MSPSKTSPAPDPVRRYTHPKPGETWEALAARVPDTDVATIQSWNTHLAIRPEPFGVTPYDIIFTEPPRSDPDAD